MKMSVNKFDKEHLEVEFAMKNGIEKMDVLAELKIDSNNLDVELGQQPRSFCFYSTILADAEDATERAKMNMSVVEADLDQKIRAKAIADKTKVTEDSITNIIKSSKEHIEAKTAWLDCKRDEGKIRAYVEAWAQRKDMLKAIAGRAMYEKDLNVMKQNT